jgi:hypothetical protein
VRTVFKLMVSMAVAGLLMSCASSEVVPSSGPRPPLSPDSVSLYKTPPKKYEIRGRVSLVITPELAWDKSSGDANAAFDQLKAQAAALGANGLLFTLNRDAYDVLAGAGYHGTFYEVPLVYKPQKTVFALAIFVVEQ